MSAKRKVGRPSLVCWEGEGRTGRRGEGARGLLHFQPKLAQVKSLIGPIPNSSVAFCRLTKNKTTEMHQAYVQYSRLTPVNLAAIGQQPDAIHLHKVIDRTHRIEFTDCRPSFGGNCTRNFSNTRTIRCTRFRPYERWADAGLIPRPCI